MTATIILALLLTTAVPVPKQDGKPCPANYRSEAHYCVPANRDSDRGAEGQLSVPQRMAGIGRLLPRATT